MGKKIDTIQIGDKAKLKKVITKEDIQRFVELTGDDNRLHIDETYARKTSFRKPVVHGMLSASLISTIIGTKLPGDGALWFSQSLDFLLPVYEKDELTVNAEVIKKSARHATIELQIDIHNQHKQKVITGTCQVKVIEEEDTPKAETTTKEPDRRVALVVGATGGIGRAVCLQLAKDGLDIIVHYNSNQSKADKIKDEIAALGGKALVVKGDITDKESVEEMFIRIQRFYSAIDVLVNSTTAKIANIKVGDLAWEDIQKHIDINIKGAFNLIKAILPGMEKQKYGKVIHITSQATETPNAEWLPYITAKSALNGFSRALAYEMGPKGIRFNLVSPGMTDTDLIADLPQIVKLTTAAKTPLRRIATPEDIAKAVSFLASEKADFITGETIHINGGQVMR